MSSSPAPIAHLAAREPCAARRVCWAVLALRLVQAVSWPVAMLSSTADEGLRSVNGAWIVWAAAVVLGLVGMLGLARLARGLPAPLLAVVEPCLAPVLVLAGGLLTRPAHGTTTSTR